MDLVTLTTLLSIIGILVLMICLLIATFVLKNNALAEEIIQVILRILDKNPSTQADILGLQNEILTELPAPARAPFERYVSSLAKKDALKKKLMGRKKKGSNRIVEGETVTVASSMKTEPITPETPSASSETGIIPEKPVQSSSDTLDDVDKELTALEKSL